MILAHEHFGIAFMQSWFGVLLMMGIVLIEYLIILRVHRFQYKKRSLLFGVGVANLLSGILPLPFLPYPYSNILWFPWNHSQDVYFDSISSLLLPLLLCLIVTIAIEVLVLILLLKVKEDRYRLLKSVAFANSLSLVFGYSTVYFFALETLAVQS